MTGQSGATEEACTRDAARAGRADDQADTPTGPARMTEHPAADAERAKAPRTEAERPRAPRKSIQTWAGASRAEGQTKHSKQTAATASKRSARANARAAEPKHQQVAPAAGGGGVGTAAGPPCLKRGSVRPKVGVQTQNAEPATGAASVLIRDTVRAAKDGSGLVPSLRRPSRLQKVGPPEGRNNPRVRKGPRDQTGAAQTKRMWPWEMTNTIGSEEAAASAPRISSEVTWPRESTRRNSSRYREKNGSGYAARQR